MSYKKPGRFGYILHESPDVVTYFDCVRVDVKDGVIYADTGNGIKEFWVLDVKRFHLTLPAYKPVESALLTE